MRDDRSRVTVRGQSASDAAFEVASGIVGVGGITTKIEVVTARVGC